MTVTAAVAPLPDLYKFDDPIEEVKEGTSAKCTWRANALAARLLETRWFGHASGHVELAPADGNEPVYKNKLLLFKLSDLQMFSSFPMFMT